jgi:putative endonuclease
LRRVARRVSFPPRHPGLVPGSAVQQKESVAREREPCVYILASGYHGTLYTGVTSDLIARLWQHRENVTGGFVRQYGVYRLVYFEMHSEMEPAIRREKTIKRWKREHKYNLIERENPEWLDLAVGLGFDPLP